MRSGLGVSGVSLAVIESALDLTRPSKANEGDELGLHLRTIDLGLF